MTFLIQQTLIYAVPLMIVALAGVFAERSGIINLALEGIMVFGAFIGVWFVRILQTSDAILSLKQSGNWVALQGVELLTMLVAAAFGALFSLLLSFASINLRADQTIGGTALNLMAPALVLFFIRIIANQNTLQMLTGDAASWFMIKKSTLGIDKNTDLGFFGETFVNKVYLATYVCILLFIILSILLYKTRFGLRLRACGENPQAADSLGINVYKMRYAGTTISGALAGMGGFVYALTTANCASNGDVAGFGFLALAVMIFGNWKPVNIAVSSLLFGLFKCIAASYAIWQCHTAFLQNEREKCMEVREITAAEEKQRIARLILESLPDWFGIPEAREEYIEKSVKQPFFAAFDGENAVGFLYLAETGRDTAELYVMGVLKEYHRRGVGKMLFAAAKQRAKELGYSFLQVKTVQMGKYPEYDATNRFYLALGFGEFEVFPTLWDEWNPCQIYVMSLK